jgi:hypothetical protein
MNKEEYLRKTGKLPEKDFGILYHFTNKYGVVSEIQESLIYEISDFAVIVSKGKNSKNVPCKFYRVKEEFMIGIEILGNNTVGKDHRNESLMGDLKQWTRFGSPVKEELEKVRNEELKKN